MANPAFKLLLSAFFAYLLPLIASLAAASAVQASSAMASPSGEKALPPRLHMRLSEACPGCKREEDESILFRTAMKHAFRAAKAMEMEEDSEMQVASFRAAKSMEMEKDSDMQVASFRAAKVMEMEKDSEMQMEMEEDAEMQVDSFRAVKAMEMEQDSEMQMEMEEDAGMQVDSFRAVKAMEMDKDSEMQMEMEENSEMQVDSFRAAKAMEMEEDSDMQVPGSGRHLHPQTFFEVRAPIDPPPGSSPCASLQIFCHSFGNSYSKPPASARYTPPSAPACSSPSRWGLVVLKWSGSSVGRQFDRISAVWIGGVEFLRTCTAEPTKQGIVWEVKKDVTKYVSVLARPQTIAVELDNLVNNELTGVFHINLTLDFFSMSRDETHSKARGLPANLVLPLSSSSPLARGHWFHITNDSYSPGISFSVPANVYKAVLEVYLSYHGDDEFWYTNLPNEYIESNNLTGVAGNGPFREVQAHLDGKLVAAIWPFPVVYTGGIINLYWRPAAAIGAFDLPTYEFDLSPFVGSLTNGQQHFVDFRVENAIGEWLIDGSLHLWFDRHVVQIHGSLVDYSAAPSMISQRSEFMGLNGSFRTTATRTLSYSGIVLSSGGNISVSSSYTLDFNNIQVYKNNLSLQTVSQMIQTKSNINMGNSSGVILGQESFYSFPLDLSCINYAGVNSSSVLNCNFSHGFNKNVSTFTDAGRSFALLNNMQQAQGEIVVVNSTVIAGVGALQQHYHLQDSNNCYNRDLRTRNATILFDKSNKLCDS